MANLFNKTHNQRLSGHLQMDEHRWVETEGLNLEALLGEPALKVRAVELDVEELAADQAPRGRRRRPGERDIGKRPRARRRDAIRALRGRQRFRRVHRRRGHLRYTWAKVNTGAPIGIVE